MDASGIGMQVVEVQLIRIHGENSGRKSFGGIFDETVGTRKCCWKRVGVLGPFGNAP